MRYKILYSLNYLVQINETVKFSFKFKILFISNVNQTKNIYVCLIFSL